MSFIKQAFRLQTRHKGFALINILGLTLGILCSTIILLYVNFHSDTDTHHQGASEIYRLVLDIHTPDGKTEYESGSSLPMIDALTAEIRQVEKTAFCMRFYNTPTITVVAGQDRKQFKEDNVVAYADSNFLELFEHRFIAGDKSTALNLPLSVVLTEKQAVKYFGRVNVLGQSFTINTKTELIVTGVIANQQLNSDLKFDVLISLPTLKVLNPGYQDQNFTWIGRNNWLFVKLREGTDEADVNQQLPAFVRHYLGKEFSHWQFHLQPLSEIHFDVRYDGVINNVILWALTGVAAALMGIVCINYINLSIAQSQNRAREIGIRKCMGCSRSRLFVQFISEAGVAVVLSVCIGLTGVYFLLPVINGWMQVDLSLEQLMTWDKIHWFFLFTMGLLVLAGYYPAMVLSGFDPVKAISGKGLTIGGINQLCQKSLITFQYTVALVFLISTLIIVNQMEYLINNDVGFSKERVIVIKLPKSDLSKLQAFRNEIEKSAGVERASLHHQAPMSTTSDGGFIKYDNRQQWEEFIVRDRWADDQFLDTYSLKLIAGRNIVLRDSLTEVVINETLLEKLNQSDPEDVVGKTILFDNSGRTGTIVGVVRDFHHRSLQNEIEPLAIYPFPGVFNQVGVRFSVGTKDHSFAGIQQVWKMSFPDAVFDFSFLDLSIANMYQVEMITDKLMRIFALVSMVVCCLGILGLSAFYTVRRTREIGIRKVLGATTVNIIMMLCRQYLSLLLVSFVIAISVAYIVMNQWLSGFAYHIPLRWPVFVVPGVVMFVITIILVGGQSLKAALSNPATSLKYE